MGEGMTDRNYLLKGINFLIIIDCLMIAYAFLFQVQGGMLNFIYLFDVALCLVLLVDFFYKVNGQDCKRSFLRKNILYFIGILPLELIFPLPSLAFRFLILVKVLRLSEFVERRFNILFEFFENTKVDILLWWILFVIIVFTFVIYLLDPSLNLVDSLWFVMSTLTTVGYGDVTPNTLVAKASSLILLILGVFIFSTLTGAISSYFTDKVINIDSDVEENVVILHEKIDRIDNELEAVKNELAASREENMRLHEKIDELLKR